jgi:hypothetical protein
MQISTASIDARLYVTGPKYSDFQHHHWDIMSSSEINAAVGNSPAYIWYLVSGFGSDDSGSWNISPQSMMIPSDPTGATGAKVRITSATTVSLVQTHPEYNLFQADGNIMVENHQVQEMAWPDDLIWSPNAGTPSTITVADSGAPNFHIVKTPVVVQSGEGNVLVLVESIALSTPEIGSRLHPGLHGRGRDWNGKGATFWQKPAGSTARAWWAWTINLVA